MTMTLEKQKMDYHVRDMSLADFGRKEIDIAEMEMLGLMATRESTAGKALSRCKDHGLTAHDYPDRCADRDPRGLGADASWCSCNIFSTQDHAAAAIAAAGVPVFAWKGDSGRILGLHF